MHNYLEQGTVHSDVIDADVYATETLPALLQCGFSEDEVAELMDIVMGVLLLGNIRFGVDVGSARVQNEDVLLEVARLWQVRHQALNDALVRSTVLGKVQARLSVNEAYLHRDALAKTIYSDLFTGIVQRCSANVSQQVKKEAKTLL